MKEKMKEIAQRVSELRELSEIDTEEMADSTEYTYMKLMLVMKREKMIFLQVYFTKLPRN